MVAPGQGIRQCSVMLGLHPFPPRPRLGRRLGMAHMPGATAEAPVGAEPGLTTGMFTGQLEEGGHGLRRIGSGRIGGLAARHDLGEKAPTVDGAQASQESADPGRGPAPWRPGQMERQMHAIPPPDHRPSCVSRGPRGRGRRSQRASTPGRDGCQPRRRPGTRAPRELCRPAAELPFRRTGVTGRAARPDLATLPGQARPTPPGRRRLRRGL